eukprot:GGOE01026876.1.p1 GENE.GGOE01026876.1~~GGOE01026876.1.p1  ORF type:complete len:499 (+),score=79.41 GGOE01026876.1:46-1542(+)
MLQFFCFHFLLQPSLSSSRFFQKAQTLTKKEKWSHPFSVVSKPKILLIGNVCFVMCMWWTKCCGSCPPHQWTFQLLCSVADMVNFRHCSIQWHTPQELIARLEESSVQVDTYDTGILFSRLNPHNPYHTLFEEFLPIYETILSTPELGHWLKSSASANSQLLVFQDPFRPVYSDMFPDYSILFPDARRIVQNDRTVAFHVKLVVAGTKASCVHAGHCSRGHFLTPDLGTQFRHYALQRLGLPLGRPVASPRVTFVQRFKTRVIANLEELVTRANDVLTAHCPATAMSKATVVDLDRMPIISQVELASTTDILVLMHGGALGNALFLPPHAVVMDIYPYGFYSQLHGYIVNGIRLSMPSMRYGHRLVETNDSSTTVLQWGHCLPPRCNGLNTIDPFLKARCVHIDMEEFTAHFTKVIQAWCHAVQSTSPDTHAICAGSGASAEEVYALPLETAVFLEKADRFTERFRHLKRGEASCDRHVECDAVVRRRFQPYRECEMR